MARGFSKSYDIIIVGAGSAGCVLANRLSQDGARNILLLEAGPRDKSPLIHVPGFFSAMYRAGRFAWVYNTAPQRHVDGRVLRDIRGKVLGGSSSVNGMLYCRGAPADYDGWAALGNEGWSYREVLPYFKRAEDHSAGANAYRGVGGPLTVTRAEVRNPLALAFMQAGVQAGFPYNEDINGQEREGFGPAEWTIRNGRRWSAAAAYLRPALRRPNLTVLSGVQACKVVLEGTRAVGVEVQTGGACHVVNASTVVLSAGAFESPHILMLSGIGDAQKLAAVGITPRVHLPGVGQNLHDHPSITVHATCTAPVTMARLLNPVVAAHEALRALVARRGVLAECSIEAVAMLRATPESAVPDVKCQFVPIRLDPVTGAPLKAHGMLNRLELTVPESRGELRVRAADPRVPPEIDLNFLSHPDDVRKLRNAFRMAVDVFSQPAFAPFGTKVDLPPGGMNDEAIDAYIRQTLTNDHHAAGTCAMGQSAQAVVDQTLRVHGVENLRVVDASIMPRVVSGNTNAPVMMIAEKAADMILARS